MSSLSAFYLVPLLGALVWADDPKDQQRTSPQPVVSITPRVRVTDAAAETILDRRADIRVDTTLVLIPVAVTDPMKTPVRCRFLTGGRLMHEVSMSFRVRVDHGSSLPPK